MWDFCPALITNKIVPKGATATPYAMMPKIFCCIEGSSATVYKGRNIIRQFKHFEKGIRKKNRLFILEEIKAYNIFSKITKKGPIIIGAKSV